MKIYFVRHGQTQYNKDGLSTGHVDVPLIEEGLEEARKTAKEMPLDFTRLYSSDLFRCRQTADILNEKLGLSITYDKRLRERNFGSMEGQDWNTFDPILKEKDKLQQYDYRPYGGESVEDVKNRLFDFINEVKVKDKGQKVLISTHGGVIRLLHNILNKQVHENIKNSSIHEFEFPDN